MPLITINRRWVYILFALPEHLRDLEIKILKMKNSAIIIILLIALSYTGFAQCDTKTILTSSTTEYLDSNNVVERSEPEKTVIRIDKSTLSITPGDHEMKGTIKENSCNWTVPYKEGKSIIKSAITDQSGDIKNATLSLEGKDGKVILVVEIAEMPGKKIRVSIDTFEEDK